MIEQSILQSLSGSKARRPEGKTPEKSAENVEKAQDFAAIMLAQRDLEGELLGWSSGLTADPEAAALPQNSSQQTGKTLPDSDSLLPEGGKTVPDSDGEPETDETPKPLAGLAALAALPELPSYRDIPILPPQTGHGIAAKAEKPAPGAVAQGPARALPAEPAQPAVQPPTQSQSQANTPASTQAGAQAPERAAPAQAPAPTPSPSPTPAPASAAPTAPLGTNDLQMSVTKAPGFSQALGEKTASIAPPERSAPLSVSREAAIAQQSAAPQSLVSLYGKAKPEQALQQGSTASSLSAGPAATPAAIATGVAATSAPGPASASVPGVSATPAPPAPQAIETLVERLVQAREAAQPGSARLSVANSDFGTVSLRFDNGASGLSVSMTNADPEFAATARTALAERMVVAGDAPRSDTAQGRGEQSGHSSTQGQNAGQNAGQNTGHNTGQSPSQNQSQNQSQAQAQAQAQAASGREPSGEASPAPEPETTRNAATGLYI